MLLNISGINAVSWATDVFTVVHLTGGQGLRKAAVI